MPEEPDRPGQSRRQLIAGLGLVSAAVVLQTEVPPGVVVGDAFGPGRPPVDLDASGRLPLTAIPTSVQTTNGERPVGKNELVANVLDFGAVGDGVTDDTAAFEAAIASVAAARGVVGIPARSTPYVIDGLVITTGLITIRGLGQGSTKFGPGGSPVSSVMLQQPARSNKALLTLDAEALTMENVHLDGNNRQSGSTLLVIKNGFELRLRTIRVSMGGGVGIDVQSADNTDWHDIFVDNCGANDGANASTSPSVRVTPVDETRTRGINNFNVTQLNIEYSQGVSLAIGDRDSPSKNYPEFVHFSLLHIESPNTYGGGIANTGWPLVRIVNSRRVVFSTPMIYGGPAPLVSHEQTVTDAPFGGVLFSGGSLIGQDGGLSPAVQPEHLVHLVTGNGFLISGTNLLSASSSMVLIDEGYGADALISADILKADDTPTVTDLRLTRGAAEQVMPARFLGEVTFAASRRLQVDLLQGAQSLAANDVVISTDGAPIILPAAPSSRGLQYTLKNATGDRMLGITSADAGLIDASALLSLAPGQARTVISDGAQWRIVGGFG